MKMNFTFAWPLMMGAMLGPSLTTAQGLNISAIGTANNASTLECWNLAAPPFGAAGAANYPIGNFTNSFVGVIPPQTYIGQAWARQIQYSIFLSGLARIALPTRPSISSDSEAYFQAGEILIATDLQSLSALGHITDFPSSVDTTIAQFPVAGNVVPEHKVLHAGRCSKDD
ncbi:hypothetical protein LTS14_009529 [Recurvomyces mirabilis]|uniref:uncharacterized protein n=1 Tax=Recurvomyces mirabilis TaxID=574656 RepID=UPI002DE0A149|nr:hypothetical protein LTS14_009529 [Recurvomyces mirabilis]